MKLTENMSIREKDLWAELLVDVLVAVYYFPRAINLMTRESDALPVSEMASLAVSTIVLAIIVSVVVFGVIHRSGESEQKDERDCRFELRGNMIGYWGLNGLLILVLAQLVIGELTTVRLPGSALIELGPLGVGHMILLAMIMASVIKVITQLYQYRRSF